MVELQTHSAQEGGGGGGSGTRVSVFFFGGGGKRLVLVWLVLKHELHPHCVNVGEGGLPDDVFCHEVSQEEARPTARAGGCIRS